MWDVSHIPQVFFLLSFQDYLQIPLPTVCCVGHLLHTAGWLGAVEAGTRETNVKMSERTKGIMI